MDKKTNTTYNNRSMKYWTPQEDAVLRGRYADTSTHEIAAMLGRTYTATYQRANKLGLYKTREYKLQHINPNGRNGISSRWKPGHTPHNKGLRESQFMSQEGMAKRARTQFKSGNVPFNVKPVGYERIYKDGRLYIKAADSRKMVLKHIYVWKLHHGAVPHGMMVTFKDGNPLNCDITNLQLLPRSEAMRQLLMQKSPEQRREIAERIRASRNDSIRKDKMRIRWGLEPRTKLVKRWYAPQQ